MWDAGGTRGPSAFVLPSGWLTRISNAESLDAVKAVADDLAGRIGFGCVTYSQHPTDDPHRLPLFFTSYPDGWIERYTEMDYAGVDPVIRLARIGRPFCWRDIPDKFHGSAGRHVIQEAREFGIVDGYCVPMLSPTSIGSFNAVPLGSERERAEALRYGVESLITLGHVVHERVRLLMMRQNSDVIAQLTPDECEMVQRIIRGADETEVADAMRVNGGEFERILTAAMRKLGVETLSQLYARSALLGVP